MQSVSGPTRTKPRKIVKPRAFVLDFVGISDKLEKALAFSRDEINAIVKTWNF
jgi:type I restriction enzyme R subunit